jgi:hypothetical protein
MQVRPFHFRANPLLEKLWQKLLTDEVCPDCNAREWDAYLPGTAAFACSVWLRCLACGEKFRYSRDGFDRLSLSGFDSQGVLDVAKQGDVRPR